MYHSARLQADPDGLTLDDLARLTPDDRSSAPSAAICGMALRDGQPISLTLDPLVGGPPKRAVVPEQWLIAAIVAASFLVPLLHHLID